MAVRPVQLTFSAITDYLVIDGSTTQQSVSGLAYTNTPIRPETGTEVVETHWRIGGGGGI